MVSSATLKSPNVALNDPIGPENGQTWAIQVKNDQIWPKTQLCRSDNDYFDKKWHYNINIALVAIKEQEKDAQ